MGLSLITSRLLARWIGWGSAETHMKATPTNDSELENSPEVKAAITELALSHACRDF
jgi:hypothetical protein